MKTILTLVCALTAFSATAQFKTLASGPVFDEPEKGFCKILLLKNKSTAFFNITLKDGIGIKIYDADHKQKVDKILQPAYGELKGAYINAIFEIKGDVVLLISSADGKTPVLYRVIVDMQTANIKEEKKIAELLNMTMGKGYAVIFGNVPLPEFYVRKDPSSNNYGVVLFNSFESDRNKRIEAVFYGEDHKEISRAFYASPEDEFKYLEYIDMAVIGNQKLSILAYAYNTGKDKGSELLLANLDAGEKKMKIQKLKFAEDRTVKWGITRYNPLSKKLMVLAAAQVGKKSIYESFLCTIDPFTQKLEKLVDAAPQGLSEPYSGMPQNLFINKDGSFTIVYEDMTIISTSHGSGNHFSSNETWLGSVVVSLFDKAEKPVKSYLVKKMQTIGGNVPPFYLSEREGSAQAMNYGNQYKSFAYLNGGTKNYVLINDIERNRESTRGKKLVTIRGIEECDGYFFNISGSNSDPERTYLFGEPTGKKTHNLGLFAISDYNGDDNIYTTLKLEKEGRQKGVRLIWLQP